MDKEIPAEILIASMMPIGTARYEQLIKKYPEYFADVIEYRRKWALVPQEIKDRYYEEFSQLTRKHFQLRPHSDKGIWWLISNPTAEVNKVLQEQFENQEERHALWRKEENELWNRYFVPHGMDPK